MRRAKMSSADDLPLSHWQVQKIALRLKTLGFMRNYNELASYLNHILETSKTWSSLSSRAIFGCFRHVLPNGPLELRYVLL